jgi:hypothetical protein
MCNIFLWMDKDYYLLREDSTNLSEFDILTEDIKVKISFLFDLKIEIITY